MYYIHTLNSSSFIIRCITLTLYIIFHSKTRMNTVGLLPWVLKWKDTSEIFNQILCVKSKLLTARSFSLIVGLVRKVEGGHRVSFKTVAYSKKLALISPLCTGRCQLLL